VAGRGKGEEVGTVNDPYGTWEDDDPYDFYGEDDEYGDEFDFDADM